MGILFGYNFSHNGSLDRIFSIICNGLVWSNGFGDRIEFSWRSDKFHGDVTLWGNALSQ